MTALGNSQADNSARKALSLRTALVAFVFLKAPVALQAWLAYRDHFLTVSQMQGAHRTRVAHQRSLLGAPLRHAGAFRHCPFLGG
jgi:hypothetical protein